MNAPPHIDPVIPYSDGDLVHWLIHHTRGERFL